MEPITVKYKVLDTRAKVPSYATPGSAAADLCAVLDAPLTLAPMERALVPTGLAIELPGPHSVALVYARSGLSIKHGLCMANGGGSGDVQCLGAAHRMELMSYAQISSRIGGAIMLVIASFIFGKFL